MVFGDEGGLEGLISGGLGLVGLVVEGKRVGVAYIGLRCAEDVSVISKAAPADVHRS